MPVGDVEKCQVFVNVSNILDTKNDNITSTTQKNIGKT